MDAVASTLGGVLAGLVVAWLALVAVLAVALAQLPAGTARTGLAEAVRMVPDVVRLLRRLARDPALPRRSRVLLRALLVYLLLPVDLVPDVVPVLGWADDALVVVLTLRHVVRAAGPDVVARSWPGSPEGLAALLRLSGAAPPSR